MNNGSVSSASSAVDKLKALLLSGDRRKIRELEAELEKLRLSLSDKEFLLSTLDPVIAEALSKKVIEAPEDMTTALAPVIAPAIKQQIKSAKEDIVDALYPVIGQSIRKAVAEAMKNLARAVNEKLDSALSFRLFRKRIEARLKGVSPDEAVLSEVLPFRIEEIFYIHKQSGILLAHASATKEEAAKDVISGMLSAIKNFSQDALGAAQQQELNLIEYDEFRIYLENGRYAFLAVVVSGIPPERFYLHIKNLEAQLHKKFAANLREFDGNAEAFSSIKPILSASINEFLPQTEAEYHAPKWLKLGLAGVFLFIFAALIWFFAFRPAPQRPASDFNPAALIGKLRQELGTSLHTPLNRLHFLWQNGVLYLQGSTANEAERLLIAQKVAGLSDAPVVINELLISPSFNTLRELQIYFPEKSAQLNAFSKARLDSFLQLIGPLNNKQILIEGFSDSVGSPSANFKISLKRALNVRQYLLEHGIDAGYIAVSGKGILEQQTPNLTKKQRALNRRVRIRIITKAKK